MIENLPHHGIPSPRGVQNVHVPPAGEPQAQEATRPPATVVTVSEYAHVKTHKPAIKTTLSVLAQPWEVAENATYAITLHAAGAEADSAPAESGVSVERVAVEESPKTVARVQGRNSKDSV